MHGPKIVAVFVRERPFCVAVAGINRDRLRRVVVAADRTLRSATPEAPADFDRLGLLGRNARRMLPPSRGNRERVPDLLALD